MRISGIFFAVPGYVPFCFVALIATVVLFIRFNIHVTVLYYKAAKAAKVILLKIIFFL